MIFPTPTFCGLDVGANGAFAVLADAPQVGTLDTGDIGAMTDALRSLKVAHPGLFVAVEKVGPFPKMGVVGAWRFSGAFHVPQAACAALSIPYRLVAPKSWQEGMGLPRGTRENRAAQKDRKAAIVAAARARWPSVEWPTNQVGRSAVADALFLAHYASQEGAAVRRAQPPEGAGKEE